MSTVVQHRDETCASTGARIISIHSVSVVPANKKLEEALSAAALCLMDDVLSGSQETPLLVAVFATRRSKQRRSLSDALASAYRPCRVKGFVTV